ncbi:carbamoylsarcosine amidase [Pusillimonas sp. T2]|uniref:isochorismatase family protein n=1 Tax=Pusillimonas sp. T2 TaxID=1548123 RepID=UPI000B9CEED2|nr:isochorismatase family protein [Pusillimonas sp. T2]OXR48867.1 carbamoylsarcosine amidase [Pusillimonas sp. T2]
MQEQENSDEAFFTARGFGQIMGFGKRPALIVVDVINGFTNPDMPLGADLDAEVVVINRLIDECRKVNVPIFFTVVAYDDASLKDGGVWVLKQAGSATLRAGTPAVELDKRLHYQKGDSIVTKKYASSFFGTDLLSRLVAHERDTLIITGCTTSGCVRATAIDAVQNGLRPMVVREGVNDRSKAAHDQSLFDLHAKYCDVVGLAEVMGYLSRLSEEVL